ncbi:hypothetical protein AA0229_2641 [Gluconobacter cerinus NRIC 0229]|nr:hypothetical protein AA0229_2641 [Gluconobacter cerinus NRIC 0229]
MEKVGEAQASETWLWIRPGSGLKSLRDPPIVSSFVKHEPGPAALTGQE